MSGGRRKGGAKNELKMPWYVFVVSWLPCISFHSGLETPGIMHTRWYSASPDVQRRLNSFPVLSLSSSPFASEDKSAWSSHDVAAVLRWGLRHLKLEGNTFGTNEGWCKSFFDEERAADYPIGAFTDKLVPKLPKAHLELLAATLEILTTDLRLLPRPRFTTRLCDTLFVKIEAEFPTLSGQQCRLVPVLFWIR